MKPGRRKALAKLLPYQRDDFYGILEGHHTIYRVTIRTLDPPLHEFLPHDDANQAVMAKEMGITPAEVKAKVDALHEFNPMLGHVAAVWASPIRKSPKCRRALLSKPHVS